ncbi:MAG: hypothetical protein IT223_07910 [Crocinitomicaceae bacterium]|nr:hypothetical protein [Crocinitomicaceae bacterium]
MTVFALFSPLLRAQIIDNRLGNAFKEEMFFNQEFLWQNKIKNATGVVSIKRPNRPIESRPDLVVYRFNEVGLLQQLDKITSVLDLIDSLTIEYHRNIKGELEYKSEVRRSGYQTTRFIYDKEGRLIRLDFGKNENISSEKSRLEPGQMISVSSETFTYIDAGTNAIRKSKYNNYGLLYSNETVTKSDLGYITSDIIELVMSNKITTRSYTYNDKGWVSQVETTDNLSKNSTTEVYSYDNVGNLEKIEYFNGTTLYEELDILYTETMLIEAILRNDLQTHEIVITKFSYDFYN